jgi:hypothetical protein
MISRDTVFRKLMEIPRNLVDKWSNQTVAEFRKRLLIGAGSGLIAAVFGGWIMGFPAALFFFLGGMLAGVGWEVAVSLLVPALIFIAIYLLAAA